MARRNKYNPLYDTNSTVQITPIVYQSEGMAISTKGPLSKINFTGAGVTLIVNPVDVMTIDIPGGGGGGDDALAWLGW
jgi:hypothetical protein